ncbi:PilN domain-containing protein [Thermosulfurimonas sp. F29]|uniref:PilN domain-containing protein n=1 Tax=Thermosulfurimonas sp. F29 TaxID=2867247 RepID=UPI001C83B97C|nr:PilN domain-containing protein [Thermosulfurimonas sp. F29]MBX6424273.1 PilN domain-containing protein [Thermosulfurimonas sp. F29]
MNLKDRLYLFVEFWSPSTVPAYFDGERLWLPEEYRRPGRLYLGISHRCLYFGEMELNLADTRKIAGAVQLEALRLLSLMEEDAEAAEVAFFKDNGRVVFVFQKRSFFEKLKTRIPRGVTLCGVFPVGLALLARNPRDGLHAWFREDRCEGIIVEAGRIKSFLPADPVSAETVVKNFSGPRFVYSEDQVREMLPWIGRICELPSEKLLVFQGFPFSVRPRIRPAYLIPWCVPLLILGTSFYLTDVSRRERQAVADLESRLRMLRMELKKTEEAIEQYEENRRIRKEWENFRKGNYDLYKIIKKLSLIFPENAWVNRFSFNLSRKEIIISGEATDILSIVNRIKQEKWVEDVRLSTVTRQTSTEKERFSLTIRLASPRAVESKPQSPGK